VERWHPGYLTTSPLTELENIVQSAIRDSIDVAAHPVLAREVCEHLMRTLLQEDQLARYVARNRIELPPPAGDVPAHVALEIQRIEAVSRCRFGDMLITNRSFDLDTCEPRCDQRELERTADAHRTGRDPFHASECLVKSPDPHCRLTVIFVRLFSPPKSLSPQLLLSSSGNLSRCTCHRHLRKIGHWKRFRMMLK
jgi:hypothetical protein